MLETNPCILQRLENSKLLSWRACFGLCPDQPFQNLATLPMNGKPSPLCTFLHLLAKICPGRYTCLLNAINPCFFAAAVVYKIVWASRAEWPFSFTQCYYWENCYKSEVLCWGDYSSTDFSFNFDLLALLTFVVVAVWGCYWSYSVSIPGACIWVKLWRYVFIFLFLNYVWWQFFIFFFAKSAIWLESCCSSWRV